MGEHDIAKHTRALVNVIKSPGHLKHKIGDIILEICIIVFAITLSLFVERYREHQNEEKLEHSFLTNLVKDMKTDITQLKDDSTVYEKMRKNFDYLKQAYNGKKLNQDSALRAANSLYNSVDFISSNSRYEALKSSGKLDVIENNNLQLNIVNYYQQTLPSLLASTLAFSNFKFKLGEYTDYHFVIKGKETNIQELMESPVYYNFLNKDGFIKEIISRYHLTIMQSKSIIKEIESEEKNW